MRIADSVILPQNLHLGGEQYSSRDSLKAYAGMHPGTVSQTGSRPSPVADVVNLTAEAKSNSNQTAAPEKMHAAAQSATDDETKAREAIVQLIEMLTGMKVKLLKQADLVAEAEKRRAEALRLEKLQQGQESRAKTDTVAEQGETSAVQTTGILRYADGRVDSFSLDMDLPKDGTPSATLHGKRDSMSRSGIDIYLEGVTQKSSSGHAESADGGRQNSGVLGRLVITSKQAPGGTLYIVPA